MLTLVYKVTETTNEHTEDILQLQSLVKHKQNTEITGATGNAERQLQMLAEIQRSGLFNILLIGSE